MKKKMKTILTKVNGLVGEDSIPSKPSKQRSAKPPKPSKLPKPSKQRSAKPPKPSKQRSAKPSKQRSAKPPKPSKPAFTLIEMLVVVGIIAVLIGASFGGYNAFVKKAARARCVELVSNVHSALVAVMQKEDSWPRPVRSGPGAPGDGRFDENVAAAFAKRGALSLTYKTENGKSVLTGNDRCGIVTPWALETLKRNKSADGSTSVPSGGTVKDHVLRYAIDDNYDGITEISSGELGSLKVRASACVWCCGADGVISPYPGNGGGGGKGQQQKKSGRSDDVYSWTSEQVVR